jgi:endonuclease/exonuclease/phosphatase family metal-dependent hydrolase
MVYRIKNQSLLERSVKKLNSVWVSTLVFTWFLIFGISCGKNPTANFAGTPPLEKSDSLIALLPGLPVDTLKVATFNMSVGFPVSQLLFTNMDDTAIAYTALDTLYKRYRHSSPSARLKIMADSIYALNLDVVGLQEVMTLSRNGVLDNDFLQELLTNIKSLGGPAYQSYQNILNDTLLEGKLGLNKINLAFSEGNALLIKPGFKLLDTAKIDYFTLLQLPLQNAPKSERCVNYVKVLSPKGIIWHFYNTHLEIFADIGNSQASELKKIVLEKGQGRDAQVILGDFNADPGKDAHQVMVEGGFLDALSGIASSDPRYGTCCIASSTLWNPQSGFSNRRIDNIFARRIIKFQDGNTALGSPVPVGPNDTVFASDHRMVWTRVIGQ